MAKELGFDLVEISRFKKHAKRMDDAFLNKIFSKNEMTYCFGFKDVATHLAGIFAAKEAVSKALGIRRYPFAEIEIRHEKTGKPIAYKDGKKLKVTISISHTKDTAGAIALG
jgi:holo-[acyl-carrier protein] synthase